MTPVPIRAVDASFDPLTREEAQCLKSNSWPVFWQCLWTAIAQPPVRVANLHIAAQEGLRIGGYISLNSSRTGEWHVNRGRAGIPNDLWEKLDFVAIDVELRGITIEDILEAIDRVEALGKKAVVYTSYNAWTTYVVPGNSRAVSGKGIPLVNALWDEHPDFDFPNLPYGGWSNDQVFMEQWPGGTHICGQFVDRNTIVNPELIYEKEEEHMPTAEYNELKQRLDTLQHAAATTIQKVNTRVEAIEEGTLKVPVWGAGEVDLTTIRHRGYHGITEAVKRMSIVLTAAQEALDTHIKMHNSTGGAIDIVAGVFIDTMTLHLGLLRQEIADMDCSPVTGAVD